MIKTLSMAVWDTNSRRGLSLKERLEMFSEREADFYVGNWDSDIYHDVFFMSFDVCDKLTLQTARSVRLAGETSYLLLVSDRRCDITELLRPAIRPSGVMFYPVNNADLRDMLYEIAAEMERLSKDDDDDVFVLKSEGVSYRIPIRDILFFEANNKKVQLHTAGQQIAYYDSLESLADALPSQFIRCHRGFLVNTSKIEEVRGAEMELRLTGEYRIPFSRSYKDAVKQAISSR